MKESLLICLSLMMALPVMAQKPIVSAKKLKKLNYQELVMPNLGKEGVDSILLDANPMYPGGINGLLVDLYKTVTYPMSARKDGVEGKVLLSFIIEKDGSLREIEVYESVRKDLDRVSLQAVQKLQPFYPGFYDGQAVRVQYFLPVNFRLED
ncbi:MAG: TonB family protein [Bacteroidota bacterium]